MREVLDSQLIASYAQELRRELHIHGLDPKLADEVVAESTLHLEEALAAARPHGDAQVRRVIAQFGSARAMAKQLAAEQWRSATKRPFLWPMIFIPPAIGLAVLIPKVRVFHDSLYSETLYLLLALAILFFMGIRARRPLLGQFLVVTTMLTAGLTVWYGATSYPVAERQGSGAQWYESVPRSGYDRWISSMNNSIGGEQEIIRRVSLGQRIFAGAARPNSVPAELTYGDQYWLPEGIMEVGIGVNPKGVNKSLRTSSWTTAVNAYLGLDEFGLTAPTSPRQPAYETPAERIVRQAYDVIDCDNRAISSLKWVRAQPLRVQLPADLEMAATPTVFMCAMGAAATNLGWLAWLLFKSLGRMRRRILYSAGGLLNA